MSAPAVLFRVYGRPGCVQCVRTTKYLTKAAAASVPAFEFEYVDVEQEHPAYAYVRNLGYSSAPVVVHVPTGTSWFGFDPSRMGGLVTAWRTSVGAVPVDAGGVGA